MLSFRNIFPQLSCPAGVEASRLSALSTYAKVSLKRSATISPWSLKKGTHLNYYFIVKLTKIIIL